MTLSGREFLRYSRQLMMADVGEEGQAALSSARVLIVGLGGLGCPVALYLAAAGIGHLSLCDPDQVELTNLQRQVLYSESDCGQNKVDCAQRALSMLNPGVSLASWAKAIDEQVLSDAPASFDVVVDCTDNTEARHWLNRHCRNLGIPLVSAAAMGWEGQLLTLDFARRRRPCLACVVPEGVAEPAATCATTGVLGPVLGVMGSMQALSVIRLILSAAGKEGPRADARLQRFDGKREQWSSFEITAAPHCPVCGDRTS